MYDILCILAPKHVCTLFCLFWMILSEINYNVVMLETFIEMLKENLAMWNVISMTLFWPHISNSQEVAWKWNITYILKSIFHASLRERNDCMRGKPWRHIAFLLPWRDKINIDRGHRRGATEAKAGTVAKLFDLIFADAPYLDLIFTPSTFDQLESVDVHFYPKYEV